MKNFPKSYNQRAIIAVMATDIKYIKKRLNVIDEKLDNDYITRLEFDPIKKIVYGLVATILLGVMGAISKLVIRK